MTKNLCNLLLKICEICVLSFQPLTSTKDYVRKNKLFIQNKAKFQKVKLNVNKVLTKDYDQLDTWSSGKKQSQTNPNKAKFKKAKMNVTSIITVDYENISPIRTPKKQSQFSKRQKPMQTSLPQRIMKITAFSGSAKQTQFKPKQTQCLSAISVAGQSQYMLPRLTINTRPNPLAHYADWPFFAVDHGPNLSCFVGLLFAPGLIFSEKKQQIPEIPYKAGPALCRFVYIRKSLLSCQGQRIIIVDFRLRIEDKHW